MVEKVDGTCSKTALIMTLCAYLLEFFSESLSVVLQEPQVSQRPVVAHSASLQRASPPLFLQNIRDDILKYGKALRRTEGALDPSTDEMY